MELQTQRLTLRLVNYRDSQALLDILNNPKVSYFNDYGFDLTMQDIRAMIQSDLELYYQGIGVRMMLVKDGIQIGSIGMFDYSAERAKIYLGYELSPVYWCQGYMREAASCLLRSLDLILPKALVEEVSAKVSPKNTRSVNLLSHLGFEKRHSDYRLCLKKQKSI
ncbi:GNAT family N-acetyltransferase [Pseudoalteromonas sp. SMS1]|uniref:GNAT family N-acetyltransferase n=1 Tax=Pseudoalteromonas sp. SMS1 TaxID=2908894 RepID=UPI001F3B782D|nr:GNAT family N-acetyltransferase [Pseudoalteromonas sp. SMS1]MCF2858668.1 GNAT family N-acetyltransferase [Pseudoalteromonas sp. SMS1]